VVLDFFFFFCYWDLNSGPTSWTTPPALFCEEIFQDRVSWTICPGWLWTAILLISGFWVARISGVSHRCPAAVLQFELRASHLPGALLLEQHCQLPKTILLRGVLYRVSTESLYWLTHGIEAMSLPLQTEFSPQSEASARVLLVQHNPCKMNMTHNNKTHMHVVLVESGLAFIIIYTHS
jgi:hypothetical protein